MLLTKSKLFYQLNIQLDGIKFVNYDIKCLLKNILIFVSTKSEHFTYPA